jgi:hypothetical protein
MFSSTRCPTAVVIDLHGSVQNALSAAPHRLDHDHQPDKVGRVAGPELLHDVSPVNVDSARTYVESTSDDLGRLALGNKRQHLEFTVCQGRSMRLQLGSLQPFSVRDVVVVECMFDALE